MIERQIEIINRLGLHARAAAKLVHAASNFESQVTVKTLGGEIADAKSILGILLLAAAQGTQLVLCCDGGDEDQAMTVLVGLIEDRFGEGS